MTVPNVLSLSRIPLGILLAILTAGHHYGAGLVVLLIALLTDVLDGYLAIKLGQMSKLGEEVLEPVCDLFVTGGALIGLALADELSWWVLVALVALAAVVQVINSFYTESVAFRYFGKWFMPMYFLAVAVVLVLFYGTVALSGPAQTFYILATLVVVVGLTWFKRHRFAKWFDPSDVPVAA